MLYVVFVAVHNTHREAWMEWMRDQHIPDVLATQCFSSATFVRDVDNDSDTQTSYRIAYRAHSAAAFDRYQAEFGGALREEHIELFGDVTRASRELLPVLLHVEAP